jgi:preprotein translocase subunit SecD
MTSKESAQLFANCVENSKYGINLVQDGDAVTIYSNISTFGKVVCAVIVCLMIIGSFVYLVLKYKEMGWVASLALMFFALFNVITFSLITSFRLTMGSYLGMLIGYVVTFFTIVILLEKIKAEFESGKKLNASFKSGYMKALSTNVDIFAISSIFSIVCLIMTSGFVYSFAYAFLINCLYGALVSLAIMLWFNRMYLKINNIDGKRLNFRKEVEGNDSKTK